MKRYNGMTYSNYIDYLMDNELTYYVIEIGKGNENTSVEPYASEFDVFLDYEEALKAFDDKIKSRELQNGEYACLLEYSLERDYFGEGLEYYYVDSPLTFKKILKQKRLEKGLTQKEVADHLDIGLQSYQKYEYGERIPDGKSMIRLINLFNLDTLKVEELIEND